MKIWIETLALQNFFSYWTYPNLDDGDDQDQADPYWATDQMVQLFNDHYRNNFHHGWKVTIDKKIFWGWERDKPVGGHKVYIKPRGFGCSDV